MTLSSTRSTPSKLRLRRLQGDADGVEAVVVDAVDGDEDDGLVGQVVGELRGRALLQHLGLEVLEPGHLVALHVALGPGRGRLPAHGVDVVVDLVDRSRAEEARAHGDADAEGQEHGGDADDVVAEVDHGGA